MAAIKVAVFGATGYAGGEVVRLLSHHPHAAPVLLFSRSHAGARLEEVRPGLRGTAAGATALSSFSELDAAEGMDLAFMALPQGAGWEPARRLMARGVPVVDIGVDFRLSDPAVYQAWYGEEHGGGELLKQAVYGLPELWREPISAAELIANPGCYPTAAVLALAPAVRAGLVEPGAVLVVDAKSGASGAGRSPSPALHFAEVNENLRPYRPAGTHRHTPEMEEALGRLGPDPVSVAFTPHLVPMNRGILATCYGPLAAGVDAGAVRQAYVRAYRDEPFVRLLPAPDLPETAAVRGTNACHLQVHVDPRHRWLVVMAAIDNLVKGAAGQAIQNMNIRLGLEETAGLNGGALAP